MKRPFGYILIALAASLLVSCTSAPVVGPVDTSGRAEAAARAFERGDFQTARDIYRDISVASTGNERNGYQIGQARSELALGNADAALALLTGLRPPLTTVQQDQVTLVRAQALFALGRTIDAVRLLVERDIFLESAEQVLANQNEIWLGLALPQSQASSLTRTGDRTIDGWLALAPFTRIDDDAEAFRSALIGWSEEFGNHPAAAGLLAERAQALRGPVTRPANLALLLPLSDQRLVQGVPLRVRALAIRDGFFAGHLVSGNAEATNIQVYDTTRLGSNESYLAAQLAGADFIIGPLLPNEVAEIQAQPGFVPTLALNIGTANTPVSSSFFQFALSSDDEIQAIATRATADGHTTAAILHASDTRGYRLRDNFRDAFEARGGTIVSSAAYVPEEQIFTGPIERMLNISQSQQRFQTLEANLQAIGMSAVFESRRREDIDMIFVQADPASGRLLVPLLRNNGAADIPTFATGEVYDPSTADANSDLDGLVFPDLPLFVQPIGGAATAQGLLAQYASENADRFPRDFAFGFDAYTLVNALYADNGGWPLAGATGELHLEADGRIRRVLPFAEFERGQPRQADPPIGQLSAR